ncbi:polysaccharide biosynthesis tyrosine autokinase [Celeribacter halophilus]|uniref:polysaccharide biosynthesis tyrosine autokinase n=1 Tax=Celeribacter halophilus TaxID=576117 RepID=UPI003A904D27
MNSTPFSQSAMPINDEIDLIALFQRIWNGRKWIVLFTFATTLIGLIFATGTPPTYRADALLQLEEQRGQLALPTGLSDLTGGQDPRSTTEIEILKSRLVLGQAVADAHMDWVVTPNSPPLILGALWKLGISVPEIGPIQAYTHEDDSLSIGLLEVPTHWVSKSIKLKAGETGHYSVILPDESQLDGQVGVTLIDAALGFALRIEDMVASEGRIFEITHLSETSAIGNLRQRLTVAERGRQTNILELGLTSKDPKIATRDLQAITDAYLRQNVERSAAEAESSLDFIEDQLPEAEKSLREAEQALNSYRETQNSVDLSFESQRVLDQITTLESHLLELDAQEDKISDKYTKSHPVYQELLAERDRTQSLLDEVRGEVEALPEKQREILNRTRELELAQQVYFQLINRAQELRVLKASTIGNIRIVDEARTAPNPVAPSRTKILALSILLGLIAGIGFVLIRATLKKGVQDAQDIEITGLPVFATINLISNAQDHRKTKGNLPLHALTHPNDLAIEGFRSLRTSLHFGLLDASNNSIAITSAAPASGKTFVAANLGVIAAQGGQKICLVDADMRMGYLRRYFNIPKVHLGLSDFLSGQASLEEVMVEGPVPDLYLIPSGQFPPNPSELLMRREFTDLIQTLNERFDLTIVDTPPALAVTDPLLIARTVGSTILVARFGETPLGEIEATQKQYLNAGQKLAGAILNGFDRKRVASGSSYSYSYRYAYGSKDK